MKISGIQKQPSVPLLDKRGESALYISLGLTETKLHAKKILANIRLVDSKRTQTVR